MNENKISKEKQALMEIVEDFLHEYNNEERLFMRDVCGDEKAFENITEYAEGYRDGIFFGIRTLRYRLKDNNIGNFESESKVVKFAQMRFRECTEEERQAVPYSDTFCMPGEGETT